MRVDSTFLNKVKSSWIENFLSSVARTEETVDPTTWEPFSYGSLAPYYFDFLIRKVFTAAKILKTRKINPKYIINSQAWFRGEFAALIYYLRFVNLDRHQITFLINFYLDILSFNKSDPFATHGINRLYDSQKIRNIVSRLQWAKADRQSSRQVGNLSVSLLVLSFALYTDIFPCAGCEFHGPYPLDDGSILIIRDFFDIKPLDLWLEAKEFKYKQVTLFTVYKPAQFFIDCYGNITCNKNMVDILDKYSVVADRKQIISKQKIVELESYLDNLATKQRNKLKKLRLEGIKKKFMEAHFYGYRELFEKAGMSWKPQAEAFKAIQNKKIIKEKVAKDWVETMRERLENYSIRA